MQELSMGGTSIDYGFWRSVNTGAAAFRRVVLDW